MFSSMDQHTYFPTTSSNGFPRAGELKVSPPETPLSNLPFSNDGSGSSGSTNGLVLQSLSPQESILGNSNMISSTATTTAAMAEPTLGVDPILNPAATFDGLLFPESTVSRGGGGGGGVRGGRVPSGNVNDFSHFISSSAKAMNRVEGLGYQQQQQHSSLSLGSDGASGAGAGVGSGTHGSVVYPYEAALQLQLQDQAQPQPRQRVQIDVLELIKGKPYFFSCIFFLLFFLPSLFSEYAQVRLSAALTFFFFL